MRGGAKTLTLAIAALLLAVGLAACGGGDSSSSTAAAASQAQAESEPSGAPDKGAAEGGGKSGGSASKQDNAARSDEAASFTPKHHSDSGGGSGPYRTKGGDNSVQEFGEEAEPSEFDAAAQVVHDFLDARAEGNWAAACNYISKSIAESLEQLATKAKQLEDKSCPGVLEKLTNPAAKRQIEAEAEEADVRSLRTEGDRAFILYTGPEGKIYSMPMASEGGAWKVASLAGYPLD